MHLSRRSLMMAIPGSAALAAVPSFAFALTTQEAEALVNSVVAEITQTINSGRSEAELYRDFERIFERYADVPTIARYSLGAAARGASSAELRTYTEAFSTYIARKYGRRFREFIGGDIVVQGSREDGNFIVVNAVAKLRGESPLAVDFLLSDRSGRPAFFNVVLEGVNMLTAERTEIGALLDRQGGDIGGLARQLRSLS